LCRFEDIEVLVEGSFLPHIVGHVQLHQTGYLIVHVYIYTT